MFSRMIQDPQAGGLSGLARAMLEGDVVSMKEQLAEIMLNSMSSLDGGNLSIKLPENFCHGLVPGLLAENSTDYLVISNQESGYGRYDVVMEPKAAGMPAVIMEFKVLNPRRGEKTLEDTVENAPKQIEEKRYEPILLTKVPVENIRKYGFAFQGKECLI